MDIINYAFDTLGVVELNHSFNSTVSGCKSVNVRSQSNQILMDIEVEGVFDGDELTEFNNLFLNWSTMFAFEINVPIIKPRYCGHSLPKREGNRNTLINAGPTSFPIEPPSVSPNISQLDRIYSASLEVNDLNLNYIRQYVFSITESNSISRYSFLYNLVLNMCGDKQANVDSEILRIEPDCEQHKSPNNGRLETIYTKLRNELAHARVDAKFSGTKMEIESKVGRFSGIVKEIIEDKLSIDS